MVRGSWLVVSAVLFWLSNWPVAADQPADPPLELKVDCGGTFDLCGFVDGRTGMVLVPRQFERAFAFSEGMAGVRINGRYGFVDQTGQVVIAPQFDLVGGFYQGHAEVLVGHKTGVIDRIGKFVVEPRFARSIPFTRDVMLVSTKGGQISFAQGYERLPGITDDFAFIASPAGYSLLSLRAGPLTDHHYLMRLFDKPSRGLLWASLDGELYGLLRDDGTWQVEPRYSQVQRLLDERAIVCVPDETSGKRKPGKHLCGAVDADGQLVVPLKSWHLSYWSNGLGLVSESGKQGLIDKSGNIVGGRLFDGADRAETGDVGKVLLDGKWVGIDRQGRIVANPEDGTTIATCPSGVKLLKQSGRLQVIGPDGRPTLPFLLDNIHNKLFCQQPSAVRVGTKWSYVGPDGRLLIEPPPFDDLFEFQAGHAGVRAGGKWGVIDTAGTYTVPPRFDKLRPDADGLYAVAEAGRNYWIDGSGKERLKPSARQDRAKALKCGADGATISAKNDTGETLWGIADSNGGYIVKPVYRAIHCFQNGVAWVPDEAKRQWCAIGADGARRALPPCVTYRYPHQFADAHPERLSNDAFENSVLWTRAMLDFGIGARDEPPRMISNMGSDSQTP